MSKNTSKNQPVETMHTIAESVLCNPVLLMLWAIQNGLAAKMIWLSWSNRFLRGIVAHVMESAAFDFTARASEFTAYFSKYNNPLDNAVYVPTATRAESRKNSPSAKNQPHDEMSLTEYLMKEYSATKDVAYAALATLADSTMTTYGKAIDSAQETYNNRKVKESASLRKAHLQDVRDIIKDEYKNRQTFIKAIESESEDDTSKTQPVKTESPTIAASVPNSTDLQAMISTLVQNALAEAMKGLAAK